MPLGFVLHEAVDVGLEGLVVVWVMEESCVAPSTSGSDPACAAMTGTLRTMASRGGNPKPSVRDGKRNTAACRYHRSSSDWSTAPRITIRLPNLDARSTRVGWSRPGGPTIARLNPLGEPADHASRRRPTFLLTSVAPTQSAYGRSSGESDFIGEAGSSSPGYTTVTSFGFAPRCRQISDRLNSEIVMSASASLTARRNAHARYRAAAHS